MTKGIIESDWDVFQAESGNVLEGVPDGTVELAKAIYFVAFNRGWTAAWECLQEGEPALTAELQKFWEAFNKPVAGDPLGR